MIVNRTFADPVAGQNSEDLERASDSILPSGDEKLGRSPSGDAPPAYVNPSIMEEDYEGKPTDEELKTLRRVPGKLPIVAYAICIVEFCERAS